MLYKIISITIILFLKILKYKIAEQEKKEDNNKNVSYGQKQMPKSTVSNSYTKLK